MRTLEERLWSDCLVCHITGLNGKHRSKRSDAVREPDSKSLAPANLTRVSSSPAKGILFPSLGHR